MLFELVVNILSFDKSFEFCTRKPLIKQTNISEGDLKRIYRLTGSSCFIHTSISSQVLPGGRMRDDKICLYLNRVQQVTSLWFSRTINPFTAMTSRENDQ